MTRGLGQKARDLRARVENSGPVDSCTDPLCQATVQATEGNGRFGVEGGVAIIL